MVSRTSGPRSARSSSLVRTWSAGGDPGGRQPEGARTPCAGGRPTRASAVCLASIRKSRPALLIVVAHKGTGRSRAESCLMACPESWIRRTKALGPIPTALYWIAARERA